MPEGEWICVDAVTLPQPSGVGTAESVLFDRDGRIGRAAPDPARRRALAAGAAGASAPGAGDRQRDRRRESDGDRRGEEEGALVARSAPPPGRRAARRCRPRRRRRRCRCPSRRRARVSETRPTAISISEGLSREKAAPIAMRAASATGEAVGEGDREQPGRLDQRRRRSRPGPGRPVGQVAGEQAGEDDHRREGGEDGGAVADPARFEVEDDEGGDAPRSRREASAIATPGPHRLRRDQRVRLGVGVGPEGVGGRGARSAPPSSGSAAAKIQTAV